jgi:hypothetical protein
LVAAREEERRRLRRDLHDGLGPASSGQTLAGAVSTATHGSDHRLPPLADWVQAIHLVAPGARQMWIERDTRAVGGLTTREIADAFYVPEATMAQRISRAKRALRGRRLDQPGDLTVVLRVLYLVYTAGSTSSTRPAMRAGWTWRARRSGSPANSPSPPRNRRRAGCSR